MCTCQFSQVRFHKRDFFSCRCSSTHTASLILDKWGLHTAPYGTTSECNTGTRDPEQYSELGFTVPRLEHELQGCEGAKGGEKEAHHHEPGIERLSDRIVFVSCGIRGLIAHGYHEHHIEMVVM